MLLDEKTAQAHFVIGYCAQFDWNWELAEKSFVEALKHKPNYSRVYLEYGHILDLQNKKAEAGSVFRKLLELGQFNPFNKASACEHLYFDRKFDEAEKLCIESERLDPGYRIPRYIRHRMYIFRNQPSKILDLKYRHKSASLEENRSHIKALENQNVRRYVQLLLSNPKISMTSMERAALYAHIGDREKAIEHLEKGVKDPFLDFYRLNADPLFESLKHENRFIELLESINIPEENLKDRR